MKLLLKILNPILLLVPITICGQQQPPLNYTVVVQVDSVTKLELYNRAKMCIVDAFLKANSVIQIDDKEQGLIVAKAVITYTPSIFFGNDLAEGIISFAIKLYLKDGRYKYEVTDFKHEKFGLITDDEEYPYPRGKGLMNQPKNWYNRVWNDIKYEIISTVAPFISSLTEGMTKPTEINKNDW